MPQGGNNRRDGASIPIPRSSVQAYPRPEFMLLLRLLRVNSISGQFHVERFSLTRASRFLQQRRVQNFFKFADLESCALHALQKLVNVGLRQRARDQRLCLFKPGCVLHLKAEAARKGPPQRGGVVRFAEGAESGGDACGPGGRMVTESSGCQLHFLKVFELFERLGEVLV